MAEISPTAATDVLDTGKVALYVGDLHPDVTDAILTEAFSAIDNLVSVRVCTDYYSGRSLCYGYVNYSNADDANLARSSKNHSLLCGKQIRVLWANRDPDARKKSVGNVFVKNLCGSIDNVGLQDLFQKFGSIVSCKVATSEDGKSKGYGFVQFETEESASAAIQELNGSTIKDKQIYVTTFVRRIDRINADKSYTNLYVKNLDPEISQELVQEKFAQFGKIISFTIARDESGNSRCFGFVNYENHDDARRAMDTMNGSKLGSKVLYVARAQKKVVRKEVLRCEFEERRKEKILKYKNSNVYLKNIEDDVTEGELREHFSKCGVITSVKIMQNEKGRNKGFGFVCFSCPDEATKAVNTFHGFMLHRKPLYVSIAQRKEDRKALLQRQYEQRSAAGVLPRPQPTPPILPGGYPPFCYPGPPGMVQQMPSRQPLMYQALGMKPGWRPNGGFASMTAPLIQPAPFPLPTGLVSNAPRPRRQNRFLINGQLYPNKPYFGNDSFHQLRNGQANRGVMNRSPSVEAGPRSTETLSSLLLATESLEQQNQILGRHLYPLVQKIKPELAGKITGMLLEMDNSELLLLIESPDSLAAKVNEAVDVLARTNANADANQPNHYLEVSVN